MIAIDDACAAADLLLRHRANGTRIAQLPEGLRPRTRADGYAIQAQWLRQMESPLFGWKIAATSAAGQRHINVDGPLAGRLFAGMVREDGTTVSLARNLMRVAEIELAFRFGADVAARPAPYGVDEVMAAVASLHPAIEIPDSRYEDFCAVGAAQLIADDACANLVVVGPATGAAWRDLDLARHPVSATVVGKSSHEGRGGNALGDPRLALTWLVNELSGLGVGIGAGQCVITGTCVTPVDVAPGDRVRASYGGFGELAVAFA